MKLGDREIVNGKEYVAVYSGEGFDCIRCDFIDGKRCTESQIKCTTSGKNKEEAIWISVKMKGDKNEKE